MSALGKRLELETCRCPLQKCCGLATAYLEIFTAPNIAEWMARLYLLGCPHATELAQVLRSTGLRGSALLSGNYAPVACCAQWSLLHDWRRRIHILWHVGSYPWETVRVLFTLFPQVQSRSRRTTCIRHIAGRLLRLWTTRWYTFLVCAGSIVAYDAAIGIQNRPCRMRVAASPVWINPRVCESNERCDQSTFHIHGECAFISSCFWHLWRLRFSWLLVIMFNLCKHPQRLFQPSCPATPETMASPLDVSALSVVPLDGEGLSPLTLDNMMDATASQTVLSLAAPARIIPSLGLENASNELDELDCAILAAFPTLPRMSGGMHTPTLLYLSVYMVGATLITILTYSRRGCISEVIFNFLFTYIECSASLPFLSHTQVVSRRRICKTCIEIFENWLFVRQRPTNSHAQSIKSETGKNPLVQCYRQDPKVICMLNTGWTNIDTSTNLRVWHSIRCIWRFFFDAYQTYKQLEILWDS